ncbi:MAG TPA: WYL domain-containing protein [Verrucomicrobiae bacterium]|nr:WYL domain-containing protein [Verrucomicrobiae bacterium]
MPGSRPPLERMLRIHQVIQAGRFPTATDLAAELEVSTKSVHRDLEFMRDRLELPLEFDRARFGYHYTEEVSAFPTVQITEGELFALIVAEKALQQYRGTSFEKPLLSAIKKMEQSLPETISLDLAEVERTISFRTRAEALVDLKIFDALAKATAARKQLELTYRKPGVQQVEQRVVDPYHLANINGEWFLFAFDHLRKDIRTFVPARIKTVRPTGAHFVARKAFSLEARLRNSFGVHSGAGTFDVVLRFTEQVADYVREKKWHDSQRLLDLPAGGVELKMRLSSLLEVERWVLNWGGNAVVVQPKELAEAVKRAARKILSTHGAE